VKAIDNDAGSNPFMISPGEEKGTLEAEEIGPGLVATSGDGQGTRLLGLSVLVIDDHQLFAEVIRSAFEALGARVLDIAMSAEDGLEAARRYRPDLILLDIGLPDESGLALGRRILEEIPESRVVAVTALQDAQALAEALRIGFQGYVTKDTPMRQFLTTVSAVVDGQVVVPKHLARRAAGAKTQDEARVALVVNQLTGRERQVLTFLARGNSTPQIARELRVSPNTVRTHIQNILTKLGVHSRLEAVTFALRHGLVGGSVGADWGAPPSALR
jgi:two-component system, NarL family, nitrate/nitrite response regulator NarL